MVSNIQWTNPQLASTANHEWLELNSLIVRQGIIRPTKHDLNGKPIKEIRGTDIIIDSRYCINTVYNRAPGFVQMPGEAYWILSGDNSLAGIIRYAPEFKKLSDDGVVLAGAYGPNYAKGQNFVVENLYNNPHSSQANIQIYEQPKNIFTKDVPCTFNMFFMIDENRLNMSVNMRANDAWRGTPYDLFNNAMILFDTTLKLREKGLCLEPGNVRLEAQAGTRMYLNETQAVEYSIKDINKPDVCALYGGLDINAFNSSDDFRETLKKIADKVPDFQAPGGFHVLQEFQKNNDGRFQNPYKKKSRQEFSNN